MPGFGKNNRAHGPGPESGAVGARPGDRQGGSEARGAGRRPLSGSSFAARFGRVILQDGIATIPSALLHYQGTLELSAQQVWFVSYILAHKWDEDLPYPSLKAMSRRVGMSLSQVQRIKNSLCEAGLLKVYPRWTDKHGQGTNAYDFSGLFDRLEELIVRDNPLPNGIRVEDPSPPDLAELGEVDPSFVARYGRVITRRGVAAVPRAIFTHQAELGLTPQQVWFITYIFSFQWDTALPYPSLRKMSSLTGYSSVQLHTIKGELVSQGYLGLVRRSNEQGGQDSNAYDFSGLLDAIRAQLQPHEHERESRVAHPLATDDTPTRPVARRRGRKSAPDSARLSGGDRIDLTEGDSRYRNGEGSAQLTGGDSIEFAGRDRTELSVGGRAELAGRDRAGLAQGGRARLSKGSNHTRRGPTSASYQGGIAQVEHEIESIRREADKKKDDSNQPSLVERFETGTTQPAPIYSPYIASVIADFSTEFNDPNHIFPNTSQALRLWQQSGLSDQQFVDLLYEAKRLTRSYQGKNGLAGIGNKMAYFFKVVRDLCGAR